MKRAFVTGCTGFVGAEVCRELLSNGYKVRGLYRSDDKLSVLEGLDIELVKGDLRDREILEVACKDIDAVFHIGALFREAKHKDEMYYTVNVEGTRNVFEAAISNKVPRIVHCSTGGVHSHITDSPANEEEEYRPADVYQDSKCEGEKLALKYLKEGKITGAVIRPAMIWGPGDRRILKLFKGIRKGNLPLIGGGKTKVHWILVSDLARAFRLAAENLDIKDEVFIISGRSPVSLKELFYMISDEVSGPKSFIEIPAMPIQVLGSIVEKICLPFGIEPPIYRRRVDFFTKSRWIDSSKAKKLLNFEAKSDIKSEIKEIASWYRQQGWI